jgi:hypothetical protein
MCSCLHYLFIMHFLVNGMFLQPGHGNDDRGSVSSSLSCGKQAIVLPGVLPTRP